MLSRTISFEILMLPDNDIRIAAAIYAIRLARNDARRFLRIAGVDLQTY
jgi:hypothetical protein